MVLFFQIEFQIRVNYINTKFPKLGCGRFHNLMANEKKKGKTNMDKKKNTKTNYIKKSKKKTKDPKNSKPNRKRQN